MEEEVTRSVGRPTVITEDVVLKLVAALQRGLTMETACQKAKVTRSRVYEKLKDDEEFRDRIHDARDFGTLLAGETVFDVLQDVQRKDRIPLKDDDGHVLTDKNGHPLFLSEKRYSELARINVAKWWLERKESKEFGAKNQFVPPGGNNNTNNYFFIEDGKFTELRDTSGIQNIPQAELVEVVTSQDMGRGSAEDSPMELHSNGI